MSTPTDPKSAYELPDEDRPASATPTEAELERELPPVPAEHDPYAALRVPAYRFYAASYSLAVIGGQIQLSAVDWELYNRTGSKLMLGFLGLAQFIPIALLSLPAGQLADIFNRKKILLVTQLGLALWGFVMAGLSVFATHAPWFNAIFPFAVLSVLFLNGVTVTFARPARAAILPNIVPKGIFSNAVTWNSSMFEVASMLGPALGGFIVHFLSPSTAYLFNSLFLVACFAMTLPLPNVRPQQLHAGNGQAVSLVRRVFNFESLYAGIHFVFSRPLLLATMTMDLFAVLLGGAVYLLPVFARDILHVGSLGYGFMRAAPAVGAFSMAMIVAHSPPMKKAGRNLLLAVVGFGMATVIFGLSRNYWLSLAMLVLTGAFDNVSVVVRHTLVQLLTPDEMRGRVSAVNQVFIGSSNELGGFESGTTAQLFGAVPSVVIGGIGTVLVVCAVAVKWPQVRRFGALQDARPDEPQGFPVTNVRPKSNEAGGVAGQ
jgi:MFS family permease